MIAAAAVAKDKEASNSSIRTNTEVDGLSELERSQRTSLEALPAGSKPTLTSKYHREIDAKKAPQRQAKACTGPETMICEGVSLASDDGDLARIHAANRKARPRGQEPIAANATVEDREIAELIRRGFIGAEDLRVDHDDFEGAECLYTVRFVEAKKKVGKGDIVRDEEFKLQDLRRWTQSRTGGILTRRRMLSL
jgi:hypothetical protein